MDTFKIPSDTYITDDLLFQVIKHLPYDQIKNLYFLRKSFNNYCHKDNIAKVLFKRFIDDSLIKFNIKTIFTKFCKRGNVKVMKEVIDRGLDPSFNRNESIKVAVKYNQPKSIKFLLQNSRVDPSVGGNCVLDWASKNGNSDIFKLFLIDEYTIIRDRNGSKFNHNYILVNSAKNGYLEIIKILLSKDLDIPKEYFNMAFRYACYYNQIEVIKLLIQDSRFDPSYKNNEGFMFLMQFKFIKKITEILEDSNFDPSKHNNAAIKTASKYGLIEIVELLLKDKRVDPSASDNKALEYAIMNKDLKMIELLKSYIAKN